jgi:hypothetical protein
VAYISYEDGAELEVIDRKQTVSISVNNIGYTPLVVNTDEQSGCMVSSFQKIPIQGLTSIVPQTAVSGTYQVLSITYTLGKDGMNCSGGIRIITPQTRCGF